MSTPTDASVGSDATTPPADAGVDATSPKDGAVPADTGAPDTGPACATGYHACPAAGGATTCADDTSAETCGTSCTPCPTPSNSVASCNAGTCAYACESGYVTCGAGCCTCGNTQTDPNNCGTCGHSCMGEACNDGVCGSVVVAQNQQNAFAITADDQNVYWTTTGINASILQALPVDRGGASRARHQRERLPGGDRRLRWTDLLGRRGRRHDQPDSRRGRDVVPARIERQFARGARDRRRRDLLRSVLLFGSTGTIMSSPVAGTSTPLTIASAQSLQFNTGLAVSSSAVYWTTGNDVVTAPLSGGAKTFSASTYPYAVATDGTNVYWASGLGNGQVMQEKASGGAAITLASNQYYPNTIAVDAKNLYWTTGQGGAGTVMSAPIGGGTPATIAANQADPAALALNSTRVFWVNFGDGAVASAPK